MFWIGFSIGVIVGAVALFSWAALKMKNRRQATERNAYMSPTSPSGSPIVESNEDAEVAEILRNVRQKYNLPALGGAIVSSEGISAISVDGVRKRGNSTEVSIDDLWHLGSDTKAMTATMIAALVEQRKLSWSSSLNDVFPEMHFLPDVGKITVMHLLAHRAGLPGNADWGSLSKEASLVDQRKAAVVQLKSVNLLSDVGSKFSYSNWGYVVVAAMAEKVTQTSYEDLMRTMIFDPLHMQSIGYGPTGSVDDVNEPWGHTSKGISCQVDNPLVMAPAGCVHCSLQDWCKFIIDQLCGSQGKRSLLNVDTYRQLHTPPFDGNYTSGWRVLDRQWGGGRVFTHAGSNTYNMAIVWMAPNRDFAIMMVCNQAGTEKACDDVIAGLISLRTRAVGSS
jgi:CubicO group peptidase (beta-lactamase class C family)